MENQIDLSELQRQREVYIKGQKNYCELRIIIGLDDKNPYAHFESHEVTSVEHALMMKCLDEIKKGLMLRDPIAREIYMRMKIEANHIEQDIKGDEK